MKLASRLTLFVLVLSVVPTAVLGLLAVDTSRRAVEQEIEGHLASTNDLKRSVLTRWVDGLALDLEELAQRPSVRRNVAQLATDRHSPPLADQAILKDLGESLGPRIDFGGFTELFILCGRHGIILFSSDPRQVGKFRDTERYYLNGRNRTYVQEVYYSHTQERPAMTIGTPVRDAEGNPIAVLAGHLDLGELSKIMAPRSDSPETMGTYLVNAFNFFVTEPHVATDLALKKAVATEGVQAGLAGGRGIGAYTDYRDVPVLGAYRWLPEYRMCIITEIDQAAAYAPIQELKRTVGGITVVVALAVVTLSHLFARTLTRPLRRLADDAAAIGEGRFDFKALTHARNEIGQLSGAFERMMQDLRKTTVSRDEFAREREFSDSVLESLPGVFCLLDSGGRIRRWNRNFEQVTGYTAGKIPGTPFAGFIAADAREEVAAGIRAAAASGAAAAEAEIAAESGGRTPYYFNFRRVSIGEREFLAAAGTDITGRKQAEEAIRRLNAELEQRVEDRTAQLAASNREMESFCYSVSHDLRSPLRAIDGFSRVLAEECGPLLDAEGQRLLNVIRTTTHHMGKLIDDLLALSRIGRSGMSFAPIDMTRLVESVVKGLAPDGRREGLRFVTGPLANAIGDPSLIRQVWANLIENAVKFSAKRDDPVIEIGSRAQAGERVYWVRDNGAGFDMRYARKLGGVFQRLHSAAEFEGNGVGLAIVQRIVDRHGGRVWAEGKVGHGAVFHFALPAGEGVV